MSLAAEQKGDLSDNFQRLSAFNQSRRHKALENILLYVQDNDDIENLITKIKQSMYSSTRAIFQGISEIVVQLFVENKIDFETLKTILIGDQNAGYSKSEINSFIVKKILIIFSILYKSQENSFNNLNQINIKWLADELLKIRNIRFLPLVHGCLLKLENTFKKVHIDTDSSENNVKIQGTQIQSIPFMLYTNRILESNDDKVNLIEDINSSELFDFLKPKSNEVCYSFFYEIAYHLCLIDEPEILEDFINKFLKEKEYFLAKAFISVIIDFGKIDNSYISMIFNLEQFPSLLSSVIGSRNESNSQMFDDFVSIYGVLEHETQLGLLLNVLDPAIVDHLSVQISMKLLENTKDKAISHLLNLWIIMMVQCKSEEEETLNIHCWLNLVKLIVHVFKFPNSCSKFVTEKIQIILFLFNNLFYGILPHNIPKSVKEMDDFSSIALISADSMNQIEQIFLKVFYSFYSSFDHKPSKCQEEIRSSIENLFQIIIKHIFPSKNLEKLSSRQKLILERLTNSVKMLEAVLEFESEAIKQTLSFFIHTFGILSCLGSKCINQEHDFIFALFSGENSIFLKPESSENDLSEQHYLVECMMKNFIKILTLNSKIVENFVFSVCQVFVSLGCEEEKEIILSSVLRSLFSHLTLDDSDIENNSMDEEYSENDNIEIISQFPELHKGKDTNIEDASDKDLEMLNNLVKLAIENATNRKKSKQGLSQNSENLLRNRKQKLFNTLFGLLPSGKLKNRVLLQTIEYMVQASFQDMSIISEPISKYLLEICTKITCETELGFEVKDLTTIASDIVDKIGEEDDHEKLRIISNIFSKIMNILKKINAITQWNMLIEDFKQKIFELIFQEENNQEIILSLNFFIERHLFANNLSSISASLFEELKSRAEDEHFKKYIERCAQVLLILHTNTDEGSEIQPILPFLDYLLEKALSYRSIHNKTYNALLNCFIYHQNLNSGAQKMLKENEKIFMRCPKQTKKLYRKLLNKNKV